MFENSKIIIMTVDSWKDKTFQDAFKEWLNTYKMVSGELKQLINYALQFQRLDIKLMTGKCSEGLHQTEIEHLGIKYVDVPGYVDEKIKYWTPFHVVAYVCTHNLKSKRFYSEKARDNGMSFEELTARMCARALRTLPSVIREYQLASLLSEIFRTALVEKSVYLDSNNHCDAKMTLNDEVYWFWSFVIGRHSIDKLYLKLSGFKGAVIAKGYHVLCGLDVHNVGENGDNFHDWALYSDVYAKKIIDIINEGPKYTYEEFLKIMKEPGVFTNGPVIIRNDVTIDYGRTKEK